MANPSIGSYFSRYFKMPSIDRRVLVDIEQVVLTELKPERYHLACQGFIYDRVENIPQDSGTAVTLVLYTHAPCLRLKLARSWAELYCEDNSPERDPIVQRIAEIVARHERRLRWRLSRFAIWAAPMLGFGVACEVVILVASGHLSRVMVVPAALFLIVTFIWWVIAYRATLFRFSHINLGH